MATLVLTDAHVEVNSVDLSEWVKQVTLEESNELQDETAMGDTTRIRKGGLDDWSITIDFMQDFAASAVDATISAIGVGSTTTVLVRPTSAAVSATNPNRSGTGILESYNPVAGQVGELAMSQVVFRAAGTLTRATA